MPATSSTSGRVDPYRAYNFKLDIGGVTRGHFTQCSGLAIRVDPIRYRESDQDVRRIPGPVDYSDVTLRYGLTASTELWDWFHTGVTGSVIRKDISIIMLDSVGTEEVLRWSLHSAWITEWRGAPLDALSKEIAIETMTLTFEKLERA